MHRRLVTAILSTAIALTLAFGGVSSIAAQDTSNLTTTAVSRNGAIGLVAAVVNAQNLVNANDTTIDIAVVELNKSLNNLRALNNVLNHNKVNINVQDIDLLTGANIDILTNALQNANIALTRVVGVAVLSGGDFIVFTQSQ
jgi:hypothetical protein